MKLTTDADRLLLQHLQELIANDCIQFRRPLSNSSGMMLLGDTLETFGYEPPSIVFSEVSIGRFAQAGLLRPLADGTFEIAVDAVEEMASPSDGKKKPTPKANAKGAQALKLVCYLTKHHQYENGTVGNYHPAESADIAREAGQIGGSTVSNFLQREFKSSGSPREGYEKACRNKAPLLHWFMVKHGDSLPTRTDSLEDYDSEDIRERW